MNNVDFHYCPSPFFFPSCRHELALPVSHQLLQTHKDLVCFSLPPQPGSVLPCPAPRQLLTRRCSASAAPDVTPLPRVCCAWTHCHLLLPCHCVPTAVSPLCDPPALILRSTTPDPSSLPMLCCCSAFSQSCPRERLTYAGCSPLKFIVLSIVVFGDQCCTREVCKLGAPKMWLVYGNPDQRC